MCTGALLRLDQSCGSVHTHDQTPRDLGVERPAVTRLLHPQDSTDPCHHLVRRRVGRFVQVNETRPDGKQEADQSERVGHTGVTGRVLHVTLVT